MVRAWVLAAVVAACALAAPRRSRAQDAAAFAQQRYVHGVARFDAHDYAGALAEFRGSLALYASPNARLLLARTLIELGRLGDAALELERTAQDARDRAGSDPRYANTAQVAAQELRELEPRIARVVVVVAAARDLPATTRVRVGGNDVPVAALGLALPVAAGRVEVVLEAPGFAPARRAVDVAAGQRATVSIALERVRTTARVVVVRPAGPGVAFAATGFSLAAAGLATTAVLYVLTANQYAALQAHCVDTTSPCPMMDTDPSQRGRGLELGGDVALGLGLGGLALGALGLVLARPWHHAPRLGFDGTRATLGASF